MLLGAVHLTCFFTACVLQCSSETAMLEKLDKNGSATSDDPAIDTDEKITSTEQQVADGEMDDSLAHMVPLDGKNLIEATAFVKGYLSEFRRNESNYISPFLMEVHNLTDYLTDMTIDFLQLYTFDEFKAGEQSLENIAGAAYQAMRDFNSLTKSVYAGVLDEIESSVEHFKVQQEESLQRGMELLKMSEDKMRLFRRNADIHLNDLANSYNDEINWAADRFAEQNIGNPIQVLENFMKWKDPADDPQEAFQYYIYRLYYNQQTSRNNLDSKTSYVQKNILDNIIDFKRSMEWGLKPVMSSVKPVQEHLMRTKDKFSIDIVLLEKEIESIIRMQKNDLLAKMWKSIIRILKQSEIGLENCKKLTESNLKSILHHLGNVTAIQPQVCADEVYANISLDMERSAVEMEELSAALRMVLVSDVTVALFVIFLLLWPVLIVAACLPKITSLVCSM